MLKRMRVLALLIVAMAGLSACGGGGGSSAAPPPPPPPVTDLAWDQGNWDELNWQ